MVPVSELDPSMSFGFLFGSMTEFNDFRQKFTKNDDINDLFSIIDTRPDPNEPLVVLPKGPSHKIIDI